MASFPNVYTHRKVAETASKRCEICFKPSTSVLVTPDKQVRLIFSPQPLIHLYFKSVARRPAAERGSYGQYVLNPDLAP